MIKKIKTPTRIVTLPLDREGNGLSEEEVNTNEKVLSILRETDEELVAELEGHPFQIRIEGENVQIYRTDANFG